MEKKIRKICLLLILCFLTAGCDVKYDVTLRNGVINEKVTLEANKNEVIDSFQTPVTEVFTSAWQEYQENADKDMLTLEDKSTNEKILLDATTPNQSLSQYDKVLPKNCFSLVNTLVEEDQIVISTSEGATCFDSYANTNEIKVNITTNHVVIEHNADKNEDNTYTWIINRENYKTKQIQLVVKRAEFIKESHSSKNIKYLFIIFAIIIGVVGVTLIYFKIKNDRVNQIK